METVDGHESPVLESRGIWDGSIFINRTKVKEENFSDVAYFSHDKNLREILLKYDSKSSFLDGLLPGGIEHLATIMLKSSNLSLKPEKENIDGRPCYVMEATGKYGYYKLWVDPDCGYNIRRAIMRKKLGDIMEDGDVLSKEGTEAIEIIVDQIKLENFNGVWFPVEGTAVNNQVYKGKEYHYQYVASRSNIKWNPDFEEIGAFKMDLPDGAFIRNDEMPGILYEWQDGRIIPYIDDLVIEHVERDVAQLLSSRKGLSTEINDNMAFQKSEEERTNHKPISKTEKYNEPRISIDSTHDKSPISNWVIVTIFGIVILCCIILSWNRKQVTSK
jgi:hypothetical protein